MLNRRIKSFDTFVIIATTSSSITLSFTGIALTIRRISTGIAQKNWYMNTKKIKTF